jgi:hypothetical protein
MSPSNLLFVVVISILFGVNALAKSPFSVPFRHFSRELPSIYKKYMEPSDSSLTPPSSDLSSFHFPSEEYRSSSEESEAEQPTTPPPSADPIPPMSAAPVATQTYRVGGVKT